MGLDVNRFPNFQMWNFWVEFNPSSQRNGAAGQFTPYPSLPPRPYLFSWCVSFFKSFQGNGYSHPLKMCFELRRDTKNFPVHLKNLEGSNECLRRVYQNKWLRKVSNTLRSPRIPLPQCHKVILSQPHVYKVILPHLPSQGRARCLSTPSGDCVLYYSFLGYAPWPYHHDVIFSPTPL